MSSHKEHKPTSLKVSREMHMEFFLAKMLLIWQTFYLTGVATTLAYTTLTPAFSLMPRGFSVSSRRPAGVIDGKMSQLQGWIPWKS